MTDELQAEVTPGPLKSRVIHTHAPTSDEDVYRPPFDAECMACTQAEVERLTDRLAKAEAVVEAARTVVSDEGCLALGEGMDVPCRNAFPEPYLWCSVCGLAAALAAYDAATDQ